MAERIAFGADYKAIFGRHARSSRSEVIDVISLLRTLPGVEDFVIWTDGSARATRNLGLWGLGFQRWVSEDISPSGIVRGLLEQSQANGIDQTVLIVRRLDPFYSGTLRLARADDFNPELLKGLTFAVTDPKELKSRVSLMNTDQTSEGIKDKEGKLKKKFRPSLRNVTPINGFIATEVTKIYEGVRSGTIFHWSPKD